MIRIAVFCAVAWLAFAPQDPPPPVVSIWYRGTPAGTPKLDDLVGLKAAGFTSVTWPSQYIGAVPALSTLAREAGVSVDVASTLRPLTRASAAPARRVDVVVPNLDQAILPALVWRAVARGARFVAFDGGTSNGTGLTDATGGTPPWVWTAIAVSRAFKGNAALINQFVRAGQQPVIVSGSAPALEVRLLESARAWIAVATNLDTAAVHAMVRLPKGVPYAVWADMMNGESVAMFDEPVGPRWDLRLGPGAARVIVIDRGR